MRIKQGVVCAGGMRYQFLQADPVENDTSEEYPKRTNMNYLCLGLRGWCLLAGLIHLFLSLIVLILYWLDQFDKISFKKLQTPVTQTVILQENIGSVPYSWQGSNIGDKLTLISTCSLLETWNVTAEQHFLKPLVLNYGTLDIQICLMVVYAVSALFLFADCVETDGYYKPLEEGKCHLSHFVEGSFNLPVMILILCARLGVTDLMTLLGAVCTAWCSMLFGQLAEVLSDERFDGMVHYGGVSSFRYHTIAHFAYWIAFIASISVLLSGITVRNACIKSSRGDDYLLIVGTLAAYLMVIFFTLFGLVQTYVLYIRAIVFSKKKDKDNNKPDKTHYQMKRRAAFHAEFAFIILSLFSKILLGILIYTGSVV